MIIKIATFLALIASAIWFATEPSWESAAASLTALAAFLGLIISTARNETMKVDRQLLRSFLEDLPSNNIIPFLKEHDFGAVFRFDNLMPLYRFVENWNNPEHTFHDRTLNKKLKHLHSTTMEFLHSIGAYTSPLKEGVHGIPRDWRVEDPENYKKAVQELNTLADEVAKLHEELVKSARSKLKS